MASPRRCFAPDLLALTAADGAGPRLAWNLAAAKGFRQWLGMARLGQSGFALLALYAQCAYAQNVNCLFQGDEADHQIQGDVEIAVPCTLTNVEIDGDVIVFAGGSLVANDVWIKGNLYTSRADFIDMERGRIDGNVRLEELVGDETTIEGTNIDGNILLARNRSRLEIVNNDIHGGMFAIGNTGGLLISGNSFEKSVDCTGNTPAPVGIANRVDVGAEGQCADLRPEGSTPEPTTPPPATSPPTSSTPPAMPATTTLVAAEDGGGAGALDWPAVLLLLPLLFLRRNARAKARLALR